MRIALTLRFIRELQRNINPHYIFIQKRPTSTVEECYFLVVYVLLPEMIFKYHKLSTYTSYSCYLLVNESRNDLLINTEVS